MRVDIGVVIPAAGQGRRLGSRQPAACGASGAAAIVADAECRARGRPASPARIVPARSTVRIIRASLTGEEGFLLIAQKEHAAWVWERLLGQPGATPIGWKAWDVVRLEAGLPWWEVDFDDTNLLPETGLERETVSSSKGCYVGQEIVARLDTYGSVSRKLMGLVCEGQVIPQARDPIMKAHEPVGEITSACLSPMLKRPIALGYVKRPFYDVGTPVEIGRPGTMIHATLTARPFTPTPTSLVWGLTRERNARTLSSGTGSKDPASGR